MKTIKGNLIKLAGAYDPLMGDNHFNIIVHGCNCFNTMGSGIAPQIANAFPEAWVADQMTQHGLKMKLGNVSVGYHLRDEFHPSTLIVVNGYTQYSIASFPGDIVVDYDAVRRVFKTVANIASTVHRHSIGYPMIGAGLAGGDWSIISTIIDEELAGFNHTLVEYDGS